MTYHGHIENGQIVLNEPVVLPEGAEVRIDVLREAKSETAPAEADQLLGELRRRVRSLPIKNPDDGLSNRDHDQVLYGE